MMQNKQGEYSNNSKITKMNKYSIIILLFAITTSCNKVKLEHSDASELVKNTLQLPKTYSYSIEAYNRMKESTWFSKGKFNALQDAGILNWHEEENGWDYNTYVSVTEKGNPYFIGQSADIYTFKTNDIDFENITGISIDEQSQTATISFTLKATNVTPIAQALKEKGYIKYSLSNSLPGELTYRKFDSGWQLVSGQNKPSSEIVNKILKESN